MYYNSFNSYLKKCFGEKVRKIGINANFTCPNRDGELSDEGCIFCNEAGFSQLPETELSIKEQIDQSILNMKKSSGAKKFIAYFQNASNTYAGIDKLKSIYDAVRSYPEIVGISISTRPDCIDEEKLDLIKSYTKEYDVWVEYGMQTINDKTLKFVNRKHTFAQSVSAIEKTAEKGIKTGVHIILGLPGETEVDIMRTAKEISELPISGVKFHVLSVFKGTKLEELYKKGKMKLLSKEMYIKLVCDFIEVLPSDCVVLRLVSDAQNDVLVAPEWVEDKMGVINGINKEFSKRGTHQGSKVKGSES